MTKVFTKEDFVEKCKWLVNSVPNSYHSEDGTWCTLHNGFWWMDCVVSIKGLLWGFKAIKNKPHGGAIYKSNGVADFGANQGIDYCTDKSTNFSYLIPGEYLCMKGTKYNHAGIYLGNNKVFECTTAWNARKCIISEIDKNGNRFYKGEKNLKWTYHGKLKYIDYTNNDYKTRVKELQKVLNEQYNCHLEVDGIFGPLTSKTCMTNYLYYKKNAPIHIRWLQQRLIELGYSCGKSGVDGIFGNDTLKAVKKFQKDKDLLVDGYVGANTHKKLVN